VTKRKMNWSEFGEYLFFMATILIPAIILTALLVVAVYIHPLLFVLVFVLILVGAFYLAFSEPVKK